MSSLLKVYKQVPLCMKLVKADKTASGAIDILTFAEPRYRFIQTVMIPHMASAESVEGLIESMWVKWSEEARLRDWQPPTAL